MSRQENVSRGNNQPNVTHTQSKKRDVSKYLKSRNEESKTTQPKASIKNGHNNSSLLLKKDSNAEIVAPSNFAELGSPQKKHRILVKTKNNESDSVFNRNGGNQNNYFNNANRIPKRNQEGQQPVTSLQNQKIESKATQNQKIQSEKVSANVEILKHHASTNQNSPTERVKMDKALPQPLTHRGVLPQSPDTAIKFITQSLKQIHQKNVQKRKKSEDQNIGQIQYPETQRQYPNQHLQPQSKSVSTNLKVNQNLKVINVQKSKINQNQQVFIKKNLGLQQNARLKVQQKNIDYQLVVPKINHQAVTESRNHVKSHISKSHTKQKDNQLETAAVVQDIKQLNSNIENIYDNIKYSGKKVTPTKNGVQSSRSIGNSSGHKNKEICSSYQSNPNINKRNQTQSSNTGSNGTSAVQNQSGFKFKEKQMQRNAFEYEMDCSSAGRANQMSAPGSIQSTKLKQIKEVQPFQKQDEEQKQIQQYATETVLRSSKEDVSEQITQSYGGAAFQFSQNNENSRKISSFESQGTHQYSQRVLGKQLPSNSLSTSKKIPVNKLKLLQNCNTQEYKNDNAQQLDPTQIYKIKQFQITKCVDKFGGNEESQLYNDSFQKNKQTGFSLPASLLKKSSAGISGSAEDSQISSGVEYKGSAGCNSGSGKTGRRRLIFQRQNQENNSIDDNTKNITKINVNRIKISDQKQNEAPKSTPRIFQKNPHISKKPEVLVLDWQVSKSNDSSSLENNIFRSKNHAAYQQNQNHNKETLQKIINYQKLKKKINKSDQNEMESFTSRHKIEPPQNKLTQIGNKYTQLNQKPSKYGSKQTRVPQICETDRQQRMVAMNQIEPNNMIKYQSQIDPIKSQEENGFNLHEIQNTFRGCNQSKKSNGDQRFLGPSQISNRSKSDHIEESMMRYRSKKNAKSSASVVQNSVESLRSLKKAEEIKFSRIKNTAGTRVLNTNRSVKSVIQNDETNSQGTFYRKGSRKNIQQRIASIKSQKNLTNQGFLSQRNNNIKPNYASNLNNQVSTIQSQENMKFNIAGNTNQSKWAIASRNDIKLNILPEETQQEAMQSYPSDYGQNMRYFDESSKKINRFKARHESGQGIIATGQNEMILAPSRNGFIKQQLASQKSLGDQSNNLAQQFASFGSTNSIQYQKDLGKESYTNCVEIQDPSAVSQSKYSLQKQKSHIVLSPIKQENEIPNQKNLPFQKGSSIQLRSARNLPQLNQLNAKSPQKKNQNIVKIHKIKKMNIQQQAIDRQISQDALNSQRENQNESPQNQKHKMIPTKKTPKINNKLDKVGNDQQKIAFNLKNMDNYKAPQKIGTRQNRNNSRTYRAQYSKSGLSSVHSNEELKIQSSKRLRNFQSSQITERKPPMQYQPYQENLIQMNDKDANISQSDLQGQIDKKQRRFKQNRSISVLSSKNIGRVANKDGSSTVNKFDTNSNTENINSMIKTKKFDQKRDLQAVNQQSSEEKKMMMKSSESVQYINQPCIIQKSRLETSNNQSNDRDNLDKFSQISSIKKDSSSKKNTKRGIDYSKSALTISPQKPKLVVKKFDLNFKQKEVVKRERPSTKIQPREESKQGNMEKQNDDLKIHKQQISEIPVPKPEEQQNLNLNELIDNLDSNFPLFSDHGHSPKLESDVIPKRAEKIKDLKIRKKQNDQIYEQSNLALQGNLFSCDTIQNCLDVSNQMNAREFSNKDLMNDLEGLLCADNVLSNPSNSIRFIDQQESLSVSQKQALILADIKNSKNEGPRQQTAQSFSSVQILKKLQIQQKLESERQKQNVQDISPSGEIAQVEEQNRESIPTQVFYNTEEDQIHLQSPYHSKPGPSNENDLTLKKSKEDLKKVDLLFDIEEEIRFNQQIDDIEIIQLNQRNLTSKPIKPQIKEESLPNILSMAYNQNLDSNNLQFAQNMPTAFNLLSPAFEMSDGVNLTKQMNSSQLNAHGIFSPSMQKSQISNFHQEMENFFPPVELMKDLMGSKAPRNIDQLRLLEGDSIVDDKNYFSPDPNNNQMGNPKLLMSNNYVSDSQPSVMNTQITQDLKKMAKNYHFHDTHKYKS